MSPQGYVRPANSIIASCVGEPAIHPYEIGANATAAQMIAGRVVVFDATDYTVKEASSGDADAIGVLKEDSEELEATAYAVGDDVEVIHGPSGIILKLTLTSGETAVRGGEAYPDDNGKVQASAYGPALGKFLESITATGEDKEILVRWDPEGAEGA